MNRTSELTPDELRRLPGLYRQWELTEVFEPNRFYKIESVGTHADGTPLLCVYVGSVSDGPHAAT